MEEIKYVLARPKKTKKEKTKNFVIPTNEDFKNSYLTYLRAVDLHLCQV